MSLMRSLAVACLVACSCVSSAVADTAYHFTVKGIIKSMPGDGLANNEILVKHQPIPEYRDESGAIVGMMAMTMPFYLAKDVSLKGIKAGDAVEFKVEQHLKPQFTEVVTEIKKVE
jgi:Cu/Ag efflux protein CusF